MRRVGLHILIGVALLISTSCSSSQPGPEGGGAPDGGVAAVAGFGPYAGLDEGAAALLVEGGARSGAPRDEVHAAPDGTVWLRRGALLEHRAATGELITRKYLRTGGNHETVILSEVVFHPDGEITVATVYQVDRVSDRPIFAAEFRRLSPALEELTYVLVRGDETLTLPERHRVANDGSFTSEPGETLSRPGFAPRQFVADAVGGLYAIDHGRLIHLDASYSVVAATWLSPDAELPIRRYFTIINERGEPIQIPFHYQVTSGELVVDRAHRVWASFAGPSFASGVLSQHYGMPVELRDEGDLFLVRFSPSLVPELVVSLPAANEQSTTPHLAESAGNTIGVTTWSNEHREIGVNKTANYNVSFAVVDADGRTLAERELDLARDDRPYAFSACDGGFCIGGVTDTTWVDTGSQVEFGKGFILKLSAEGEQDRLWTLHGPRNNEVRSLAGGVDGAVFFTATTNGPITHTDPAEFSWDVLLGKLQL